MGEVERADHQEAEAVVRRLSALQAVGDVAFEYARLQDLLPAMLQRIQAVFGVDNVAILLPTEDESELTLYSVHGPEEAVMGKVHVPMGQGVAGTIAASRKPLFVENLTTVPVANRFLQEHFRSLLGVPLVAGGRLIGVIHIDSIEPRCFTEEDSQLLQAVAERIAVAISRAQQYENERQALLDAERQVAVLQETTRRMDEFLGIASHELRTPLTSLTMNLHMLDFWLVSAQGKRQGETTADYLNRAAERVKPIIERSRQSAKRLDRLVGDLLEAMRIREHRLALIVQPCDLVSVAREMIIEQRQTHPGRVIELEGVIREPLIVQGDAERIGQVITNYLSNALKYSQADQVVRVVLAREEGQARVAVCDQGIGIPTSEQGHIWERFYQVAEIEHQSGSAVGLGLGLYISQEIIARHGGQVGVESAPKEGSTFWFTLPLSEATTAAHG